MPTKKKERKKVLDSICLVIEEFYFLKDCSSIKVKTRKKPSKSDTIFQSSENFLERIRRRRRRRRESRGKKDLTFFCRKAPPKSDTRTKLSCPLACGWIPFYPLLPRVACRLLGVGGRDDEGWIGLGEETHIGGVGDGRPKIA